MLRYLICFLMLLPLSAQSQNFQKQQLQYSRVRVAKAEKDSICRALFRAKGIKEIKNICLRAFKAEGKLELWAKSGNTYVLVKEYEVCSSSGTAGPKRIQGDGQVPEGFYKIDRFNPQSAFYLSLGVSYPNQADRKRNSKNPGGDIFIHGSCVTIGCLPLTDEYIKELYWICVLAKNNGQADIPVHIFPARMNDANMKNLQKLSPADYSFWQNLKEGYDYFESKKQLPLVTVDAKGKYLFR